jgi:hypothetical protein
MSLFVVSQPKEPRQVEPFLLDFDSTNEPLKLECNYARDNLFKIPRTSGENRFNWLAVGLKDDKHITFA